MKKCPNGHEVGDNVKFCPQCGAQVTSRRSKKTESHNNDNQNLSIAERIALGFAGFVAFVGLCGGFADSMWITVIASICALIAVCAVFKGYIEKKYAWTTAICSFLAVFITIGATAPDREHYDEASSKGENISQKVEKAEKEETMPLKGSKDLAFIKSMIGNSVWTYTPTHGNPIPHWYKLQFKGSTCEMYNALPRDGKWSLYFKSPYSVIEKRLDDGKRYVFVYLKYFKDTNGGLEEPYFPTGINITEGSFIFGAMGAIGYIEEGDYKWD